MKNRFYFCILFFFSINYIFYFQSHYIGVKGMININNENLCTGMGFDLLYDFELLKNIFVGPEIDFTRNEFKKGGNVNDLSFNISFQYSPLNYQLKPYLGIYFGYDLITLSDIEGHTSSYLISFDDNYSISYFIGLSYEHTQDKFILLQLRYKSLGAYLNYENYYLDNTTIEKMWVDLKTLLIELGVKFTL